MAAQSIQFVKFHAFIDVASLPTEPHGALACKFSESAPGCGVRILCDPSVPAEQVCIDPAKPEQFRVGPDAFHALTALPEDQKAKIPVCAAGRGRSGR